MILIGVVNIDTSHPLAFSRYLQQGDRARYAAIYNDSFRGDDEIEAFIKNHGLEKRCSTIDQLADCTDVGFLQGTDWDKHLGQAQPFIDRGKPVFIDKPFIGKMSDCRKVEALAAAGARILGSSSLRYVQETTDFLAMPLRHRRRRGTQHSVRFPLSPFMDYHAVGAHAPFHSWNPCSQQRISLRPLARSLPMMPYPFA